MSAILDSALTEEQLAECALNDAAMEAARIQADLDYLANQQRRERDRLALLQELELAELRRAGW